MARGLTKDIGLSNFTITKTENLLKTAKILPAVNQGTTCTVNLHTNFLLYFHS